MRSLLLCLALCGCSGNAELSADRSEPVVLESDPAPGTWTTPEERSVCDRGSIATLDGVRVELPVACFQGLYREKGDPAPDSVLLDNAISGLP